MRVTMDVISAVPRHYGSLCVVKLKRHIPLVSSRSSHAYPAKASAKGSPWYIFWLIVLIELLLFSGAQQSFWRGIATAVGTARIDWTGLSAVDRFRLSFSWAIIDSSPLIVDYIGFLRSLSERAADGGYRNRPVTVAKKPAGGGLIHAYRKSIVRLIGDQNSFLPEKNGYLTWHWAGCFAGKQSVVHLGLEFD